MDELLLLSGQDIPFVSAQIAVHPPKVKEIAYIGEEHFFLGSELLILTKKSLAVEDKTDLDKLTNFDIIMSILNEKNNLELRRNSLSALQLLLLLFPDYNVQVRKDHISLLKPINEQEVEEKIINNSNYGEFKNIITNMFCLHSTQKQEYNPGGDLAKKIANKLKQGAQQRAAFKGQQQSKIAVLSRYASILSIGLNMDLNSIMNYTVYQLYDAFKRFELKMDNDIYMQFKIAGAKDMKEIDSWMKDMYSDD